MKRFLWALPMLLIMVSVSAFGDTVYTITNARILLRPNQGAGDNLGFFLSGNGVFFTGGGGTPGQYFYDQGYAPGSTLGGATDIFNDIGDNYAEIGNAHYGSPSDSTDYVVYSAGLFLSPFTLPTNGQNFAITVAASLSISGTLYSGTGQNFTIQNFTLIGNTGGVGQLTFFYSPYTGLYYPSGFTTFTNTPEPGTLGLTGSGLIAMLGLIRRKLRMSPEMHRAL